MVGYQNQPTSHDGGCLHRKVQNPSALTTKSMLLFKITMIHKIYFYFSTHWDAQNTGFHNEEILIKGQIFFNSQGSQRSFFVFPSITYLTPYYPKTGYPIVNPTSHGFSSFFPTALGLLENMWLSSSPTQSWAEEIKSAETQTSLFCSLLVVLIEKNMETVH